MQWVKFQYDDCCHRLSKCAAPQPDVLMALPRKMSLKRTLNSKRQKLQSDSRSISYPLPKDAAFSILDKFQHMILCGMVLSRTVARKFPLGVFGFVRRGLTF